MNWDKRLFWLWLVLSIFWAAYILVTTWFTGELISEPDFILLITIGLPVLLGYCCLWVWRVF